MKVGFIAEPNSKGQIVIPKKIRDELKIDQNTHLNMVIRDNGIYIHTIKEIVAGSESNYSKKALLEALEKTRGLWADDKDFDKRQKERRKIELKASRERKKPWW